MTHFALVDNSIIDSAFLSGNGGWTKYRFYTCHDENKFLSYCTFTVVTGVLVDPALLKLSYRCNVK